MQNIEYTRARLRAHHGAEITTEHARAGQFEIEVVVAKQVLMLRL